MIKPAVACVLLLGARAAMAQDPAPPEQILTGSVDVGYRWRTDVGGSLETYRSVVDLGSGPKLLGADFSIVDKKLKWFDRIDVRAHDWGGDPDESLRVDVRKAGLYHLSADYRDIAYFNNLPSFADPLRTSGMVLDERAFDVRQKIGSYQLDLLPGHWWAPYFAVERNTQSGSGVNAFVVDANQYAVPEKIRNSSTNYRGGVHLDLPLFHVTLEQGGVTYKDDESEFVPSGSTSYGNVAAPLLGQTLDLTSLLQAYGVRGDSIYTRGLLTANPVSWLDLYGQFLYSEPETNVNYQKYAAGNFAVLSQAVFLTALQSVGTTEAKLPHTAASFGFEIRPARRIRVTQSWLTDRLHQDGSSLLNAALVGAQLVNNESQEETRVFVDLTKWMTLRGGFRYIWGNASDALSPVAGIITPETAKLHRKVGIGGVTVRPGQKVRITADIEGASGDDSYFRTSLQNYIKVHAVARYQASRSLSISGDMMYLNNDNPAAGAGYKFRAMQESATLRWAPADGKRFDVEGEYTRSTLRSNISYLDPGFLIPQQSLYRDYSHISSLLGNVKLATYGAGTAQLSGGGSLYISSGSRPSTFYQPLFRLSVPLHRGVSWNSEWRYYGFGEGFYQYESFRTHTVTTGFRLSR